MAKKSKYIYASDLKIGDRFTFKNRKTLYIFEGFDNLSECAIASDVLTNRKIIYFDIESKVLLNK